MQFMMRLHKEVVRGQIPLSPPPLQPKHFSPIPHLIVFYPAAKLMSLEHYYNRFKLEKRGRGGEKSQSHLLSLPVPAAVIICSHKHGSAKAMAKMPGERVEREKGAGLHKLQHHLSKTCTVTRGVYTELSTHA